MGKRGRARGRYDKAVRAGAVRAMAQANGTTRPQTRSLALADALNLATGNGMMPDGTFIGQTMPRDPRDMVPFGPNWPLPPQPLDPARRDTGRPEPRVTEYPVSWNLPGNSRRPVPWNVLYAAAQNVDVIRRCIEIRKAHVMSKTWAWRVRDDIVDTQYAAETRRSRRDIEAELRTAFLPEISRLTQLWERPWKSNGLTFAQWIAAVVDQRLTLDAVAIYPQMTYGGELLAFEIIDGATIKPLLDWRGSRPVNPYPAFQQEVYGFPRSEFTARVVETEQGLVVPDAYMADQLYYARQNFRPNSPYGLPPTETALISARLYLKRQGWMLAEYDDGSTPMMWLAPDGTPQMMGGQSAMTVQQRRDYEAALNDELTGQTAARHRIKVAPPGHKPIAMPSVDERYKPEYDMHLIKMLISHFGVTSTEYGFSETQGLGNSGLHEGQEKVGDRVGTDPDMLSLAEMINTLSTDYARAPVELLFGFSDPTAEDAAAEDAMLTSRRARGVITLNDDRHELGLSALDFPEADMPLLIQGATAIPLEGLAERLAQQDAQAQQMTDAKASTAQGAPAGGDGTEDAPEDVDKAVTGEGLLDAKADELAAFARWRRRNPDPARPFVFKFCEPDDLNEAHPRLTAFADWVYVDAEQVEFYGDDIQKYLEADLVKAYEPWWPRDKHGKWIKRTHLGSVAGPDRPGKEVLAGLEREAVRRRGQLRVNDSSSTVAPMDTPSKPKRETPIERRARIEQEAAANVRRAGERVRAEARATEPKHEHAGGHYQWEPKAPGSGESDSAGWRITAPDGTDLGKHPGKWEAEKRLEEWAALAAPVESPKPKAKPAKAPDAYVPPHIKDAQQRVRTGKGGTLPLSYLYGGVNRASWEAHFTPEERERALGDLLAIRAGMPDDARDRSDVDRGIEALTPLVPGDHAALAHATAARRLAKERENAASTLAEYADIRQDEPERFKILSDYWGKRVADAEAVERKLALTTTAGATTSPEPEVKPSKPAKAPKRTPLSAPENLAALKAMTSREDAAAYVEPMGGPELRELAAISPSSNTKGTLAEIRRRLVSDVGQRLSTNAILDSGRHETAGQRAERLRREAAMARPAPESTPLADQLAAKQAEVRQQLANAEVMFGSDRSKWSVRARQAAERAERVLAEPATVSGAKLSTPAPENTWGGPPETGKVHYHPDGRMPQAIEQLGDERRIDVDGRPLGAALGMITTDTVTGRITVNEALSRYRALAERLPQGRARREIESTVAEMQAPATLAPAVPAGTPEPLARLVGQLHAVPVVRRDPGKELTPLIGLLESHGAGEMTRQGLIRRLRELANRRHESTGDEGKFEIDRAIQGAIADFEAIPKADAAAPSPRTSSVGMRPDTESARLQRDMPVEFRDEDNQGPDADVRSLRRDAELARGSRNDRMEAELAGLAGEQRGRFGGRRTVATATPEQQRAAADKASGALLRLPDSTLPTGKIPREVFNDAVARWLDGDMKAANLRRLVSDLVLRTDNPDVKAAMSTFLTEAGT